MFQHIQTEFLAFSKKYFFDYANILEVKAYNNTLLTRETKELINLSLHQQKEKTRNLKQMQFLGMPMQWQ